MIWYQREKLKPRSREIVLGWELMNRDVAGTAVIIPVSGKSAVIAYVRDQVEKNLFFVLPREGDDAVFYHRFELIPTDEGHNLQARVKRAVQNWKLESTALEKEMLLESLQ